MVLGLTGHEPVIEIKTNNVFCSLCRRAFRRGDEAVDAGGGSHFIHFDCAVASFTGALHRVEMKNVRSEGKARGRRQKKKEHESSGDIQCVYCRKTIDEPQPFVLIDKMPYHSSGRNSCAVRFRRVMNMSKQSLY